MSSSTSTSDPFLLTSSLPDVTVPHTSITDFILHHYPKADKSKPAFIDIVSNRQLTYSDLEIGIHSFAAGLQQLIGLKPGDVVAINTPNVLEYPILVHGSIIAGGIVSPSNPLYTAFELAHQLKNSGASVVVTTPTLLEKIKEAVTGNTKVTHIIVVKVPAPTQPVASATAIAAVAPIAVVPSHVTVLDYEEIVKTAPSLLAIPSTDIDVNATVLIPYSSGTSGLSKGVELTHANLIANILQMNVVCKYVDADVLVGVLPFFHIFGHQVPLNSTIAFGMTTILTGSSFDPVTFLSAIQTYKISVAHLVPPILLFMTQHPVVAKFDLTSLREIFSGAAPLGPALEGKIRTRFPHARLRQGYGATETAPGTHTSPDNVKVGSIGILLPNITAYVVDVETGAKLGPGEKNRGELWVKGVNVMKQYLNNPAATASTIDADGFFHTGDIAYYDEDHHFFIVDRLKELIKCKGFQVAPAELESVLLSHPAVADSAVIGIPDERAGELPRAYIVKKKDCSEDVTESIIQEFIASKLSEYKQLKGGVEFIEVIPKSAAGKILRRVLKEKYAAESKAASTV